MGINYQPTRGLFLTQMSHLAVCGIRLKSQEEPELNTIASLLLSEDILLNLNVWNKSQLFDEIGQHMERAHAVPKKWVAPSLFRREQVGSTGLGEGVAIPHARVLDLDRIQVAYARLDRPIPFDAPDGKPVSDVLVLLVPKQATEEHLRILADATRLFSNQTFREQLHRCNSPMEVKRLFEAWRETPS
jgi:PTS system nitrogen regulatory IIA component